MSKLLRSKVQPKPNINIDNINHDEEVSKNFWSYCKPVALKVLTSLIRDRIYSFLASNNYIESEIQKGFVLGMSGTYEHIANLSYLINHARKKQKNLTITLIDLRNAFGEVHHNLIDTIFEYHHADQQVRDIVKLLYRDFYTSIITDAFTSDFIKVSKGVLKGDCLSSLLFDLVINTFIQHIKQNHYNQLGYKFFAELIPRYLFQFADEAAALSCLESENQILINASSRWCNWANMIIRVDKCHSFGIKTVDAIAKQIQPKLYLNNKYVKPVKTGESFLYLGRYFEFEMSSNDHKTFLTSELNKLLEAVDKLPLQPKNKLLIYQNYILSKLSWHLTVAELNITWMKQNLDNVANSYVRSWLETPVSGTLDIVTLSYNKYGLNIHKLSTKFTQCQVTFRLCLRNSTNADIRRLDNETSKDINV